MDSKEYYGYIQKYVYFVVVVLEEKYVENWFWQVKRLKKNYGLFKII